MSPSGIGSTRVVEKYPSCDWAKRAWLNLAQNYFNKAQWADAAMSFEAYLQKLGEQRRPANVLYDLGWSYEQMNELDLAAATYREFIIVVNSSDPRVEIVQTKLEEWGK